MKGIYVLVIEVKDYMEESIGSLGKLSFEGGLYLYIGSAQNNLELRLRRHLSKNKKLHWHIDYLLKNEKVRIKKVLFNELDKSWECKIASLIEGKPVPKFGSSDCGCISHLFKVDESQIKFLNNLGFKDFEMGE